MQNHFISCDWGTSSFRLRLVSIPELKVVKSLYHKDKGFGQISLDREEKMRLLRSEIKLLLGNDTAHQTYCIISGMASSTIGIQELPYTPLPLDLSTPNLISEQLDEYTLLLSGVASDEDVMRGEEVQIIGAAQQADLAGQDSLGLNSMMILPGTHSKHAVIQNGRLINFRTYMTGEVFALLQNHSILQHSLKPTGTAADQQSFLRGVAASAGPLLHELFTIRARHVLGNPAYPDPAAYLSGLLIGNELRATPDSVADSISLIADGPLAELYQKALQQLYGDKTIRLFSTEEATILGQYQCLQQLNL
jgi:2-dehydro-3-deoxygalactonokinase